MTLFIQRHQDTIFVNQLEVGRLVATNWQTGQECRPGAEWLEIAGPRPRRSVVEVCGDEDISAALSPVLGEDVEMSSRPNHSIDPELAIQEYAPADFYYWRGLCVGSNREFGLFWDGGPKQLQWLPKHRCRNLTPPRDIIAEMLRRALASEPDHALPDRRGWKLWPPVRHEDVGPYVAMVRITGEPEEPVTQRSGEFVDYMQVIRRGDTNEIACAGLGCVS